MGFYISVVLVVIAPLSFLFCLSESSLLGEPGQRFVSFAQMAKNLPLMQETWVWSLGQEDPLEKEMATHSSYSCLENSMDRGAWWATVHGVTKSWTWLTLKEPALVFIDYFPILKKIFIISFLLLILRFFCSSFNNSFRW